MPSPSVQPDGHKASQWAIEVASPQDFGALMARDTPYVMFTQLALPPQCWNYAEGLEYQRDFSHNTNLIPSLHGFSQLQLHSQGWHRNPADSASARAAFEAAGRLFFPLAPEREETLSVLSLATARFAAGVNYANLRVDFRVTRDSFDGDKLSGHYDGGEDMTGGIYLKGMRTVQYAPAADAPLERVGPQAAPREHQHLPHVAARLRCVPPRCMSAWPPQQKHSDPVHQGGTRVAIFLFASQHNHLPAL